jgi:hypothetical protein
MKHPHSKYTLGQIVTYAGEAAIVTALHADDGTVDLTVFQPNGGLRPIARASHETAVEAERLAAAEAEKPAPPAAAVEPEKPAAPVSASAGEPPRTNYHRR